jgi:hypothetical protein
MLHRRRTDAAQSSQRLRWRMSYRFSMKAAAEGRHFVFDVAHVQRPRTAVTMAIFADASNSAVLIHFIVAEFHKLLPQILPRMQFADFSRSAIRH